MSEFIQNTIAKASSSATLQKAGQFASFAAPAIIGGIQASSQLTAAQNRQAYYNAQAAQATIKGRSQAIAYKQQAADVLRNMNETSATVLARAAAGGVDPLSGSAATLTNYTMKEGVREYSIAKDNSVLSIGMADYQAEIYKDAGRSALQAGQAQAFGTLATGIYRSSQIGFPSLDISAKAPV